MAAMARHRGERSSHAVDPGGRPDPLQAQPAPTATPAQLTFLEGELARFVESGAWEFGTCRKWVSRLFLVPKPGVNHWRCIINLRVLNSYCVRKRLKMETLMGVRHPTKRGDYMFSFDLQDGFYALGIAEVDRDYFTVDVRAEPHKGFWEPCQLGMHLGVDIDSASGMFYAPADKLDRLSRQATRLIGRTTRNARLEAPGFWTSADERHHINWKELKAVRLAVERFFPHAGRNVLLHEDNRAVCHDMSGVTSRSPKMMAELRRLWCLLDSHGIHLRAVHLRGSEYLGGPS
eukprot:jgi/Tetstr1/438936/TSEL_002953.t1